MHETLFNPNDPKIGSQYHFANIKAYEAWDVTQGDTNIVIGITDTGIELDHEDIAGNIKYNYDDPINGIDDDNDGYLDNFHGWNTGSNTNDPSVNAGGDPHGHMVSGTSSAITNNGVHVAGVGFKSKILPVKISNESGFLTGSYGGIVYAADHGAQIINCSWGSVDSWSQYGQDVVTYAAINHNCLVVCAAGNDNNEGIFYPASFDWALSVAATESSDAKWDFQPTRGSNFNEHVDIAAPGRHIYTLTTTAGGGSIGGRAGTSFSAPIVSGGAAIAWSRHKSYTGMQIGELLKATADSLEFVPGNAPYSGKLGEGLLNMHRSVTESGFPGLYMYQFNFAGNNQNKMAPGDTAVVSGKIINFLENSSPETTIQISSNSQYIQFIDSVIKIGTVNSLDTLNLASTPFKFVVLPGIPISEQVGFTFTLTDRAYNTKRFTQKLLNFDYVDVQVNRLGTTVGSSGKIGYNKLQQQVNGLGVTYDGSASLLFQMGLMIADNDKQISYVLDGDFDTQSNLKTNNPGLESDFDIFTQFNDEPADSSLQVSVNQKTLAWKASNREKFVLIECEIHNNSLSDYSNLHLGVYADWDIGNYIANEARYDATTHTAYMNEIGGAYGAIHLLDKSTKHHYAYNNDGSGGSASIYDGYDENEQYTHLTGGNSRPTSAITDASHLIGNGPYFLASGDSMYFTFAIIVGDDLLDIQTSALASDSAYNEIRIINVSLVDSTLPQCHNSCDGSISLAVSGGIGSSYQYLWNDPRSQTTATATGLCPGTYQCVVTDSIGTQVNSSMISLANPSPLLVNIGSDTTICSGDSLTIDAGNIGSQYLWSTSDTSQQIAIKNAGLYWVKVTNPAGCLGHDSLLIFTSNNPAVNLGKDTMACFNTSIKLDAGNPGLNFLWSSGGSGQSESFSTNGIHWVEVTNFANCFKRDSIKLTFSALTEVNIGNDTTACKSYSGILDAGNTGLSFLWNSGSVTQTVAVNSAGTYFVRVNDGPNCSLSDTIVITVEPTPNINLGNDTTVCKSSNLVLDAGIGSSYLWNNGFTERSILVNSPGKYAVKVGNSCSDQDSVLVSFFDAPIVWFNSSFETARNSSEGNVTLTFGEPAGGTYEGPGVTGSVFNTISAGDGVHKINYTFTDLLNGCAASTWIKIDVNPSVFIEKIKGASVRVVPNPFQDEIVLYLNSSSDSATNFQLFDDLGRLIMNEPIATPTSDTGTRIKTSHLNPGVFYLVIQGENFQEIVKIIKVSDG